MEIRKGFVRNLMFMQSKNMEHLRRRNSGREDGQRDLPCRGRSRACEALARVGKGPVAGGGAVRQTSKRTQEPLLGNGATGGVVTYGASRLTQSEVKRG